MEKVFVIKEKEKGQCKIEEKKKFYCGCFGWD